MDDSKSQSKESAKVQVKNCRKFLTRLIDMGCKKSPEEHRRMLDLVKGLLENTVAFARFKAESLNFLPYDIAAMSEFLDNVCTFLPILQQLFQRKQLRISGLTDNPSLPVHPNEVNNNNLIVPKLTVPPAIVSHQPPQPLQARKPAPFLPSAPPQQPQSVRQASSSTPSGIYNPRGSVPLVPQQSAPHRPTSDHRLQPKPAAHSDPRLQQRARPPATHALPLQPQDPCRTLPVKSMSESQVPAPSKPIKSILKKDPPLGNTERVCVVPAAIYAKSSAPVPSRSLPHLNPPRFPSAAAIRQGSSASYRAGAGHSSLSKPTGLSFSKASRTTHVTGHPSLSRPQGGPGHHRSTSAGGQTSKVKLQGPATHRMPGVVGKPSASKTRSPKLTKSQMDFYSLPDFSKEKKSIQPLKSSPGWNKGYKEKRKILIDKICEGQKKKMSHQDTPGGHRSHTDERDKEHRSSSHKDKDRGRSKHKSTSHKERGRDHSKSEHRSRGRSEKYSEKLDGQKKKPLGGSDKSKLDMREKYLDAWKIKRQVSDERSSSREKGNARPSSSKRNEERREHREFVSSSSEDESQFTEFIKQMKEPKKKKCRLGLVERFQVPSSPVSTFRPASLDMDTKLVLDPEVPLPRVNCRVGRRYNVKVIDGKTLIKRVKGKKRNVSEGESQAKKIKLEHSEPINKVRVEEPKNDPDDIKAATGISKIKDKEPVKSGKLKSNDTKIKKSTSSKENQAAIGNTKSPKKGTMNAEAKKSHKSSQVKPSTSTEKLKLNSRSNKSTISKDEKHKTKKSCSSKSDVGDTCNAEIRSRTDKMTAILDQIDSVCKERIQAGIHDKESLDSGSILRDEDTQILRTTSHTECSNDKSSPISGDDAIPPACHLNGGFDLSAPNSPDNQADIDSPESPIPSHEPMDTSDSFLDDEEATLGITLTPVTDTTSAPVTSSITAQLKISHTSKELSPSPEELLGLAPDKHSQSQFTPMKPLIISPTYEQNNDGGCSFVSNGSSSNSIGTSSDSALTDQTFASDSCANLGKYRVSPDVDQLKLRFTKLDSKNHESGKKRSQVYLDGRRISTSEMLPHTMGATADMPEEIDGVRPDQDLIAKFGETAFSDGEDDIRTYSEERTLNAMDVNKDCEPKTTPPIEPRTSVLNPSDNRVSNRPSADAKSVIVIRPIVSKSLEMGANLDIYSGVAAFPRTVPVTASSTAGTAMISAQALLASPHGGLPNNATPDLPYSSDAQSSGNILNGRRPNGQQLIISQGRKTYDSDATIRKGLTEVGDMIDESQSLHSGGLKFVLYREQMLENQIKQLKDELAEAKKTVMSVKSQLAREQREKAALVTALEAVHKK